MQQQHNGESSAQRKAQGPAVGELLNWNQTEKMSTALAADDAAIVETAAVQRFIKGTKQMHNKLEDCLRL